MFSTRFPYQSSSNPLIQLLHEKKSSGGEDVIDLTESNPTVVGFDSDEAAILESLSQPSAMHYHPDPQGLISARRVIVNYYQQHALSVDLSSLFLTAGTSEAYSYLFKLLLNPGEEVLIPRPSYPLFELLAGLESVQAVEYPLMYCNNEWRIDIEALNNSVSNKTRAVIVVSPNNPTGSYLKPNELEAVNQVCRDHGCALIVDEVFFDYASRKRGRPVQSACQNKEVLTFVLSGISKVLALPQLKMSWILVSGPTGLCAEARNRLEFIADTYLSVSAPVQVAAEELFKFRKDIQVQIINRVEKNEELLVSICEAQSKCNVLKREGGWYAVLRIEDGYSDEEVAYQLLKEDNVFIHPGYFYNFTSRDFIVLSLLPQPHLFQEGINKLIERCEK